MTISKTSKGILGIALASTCLTLPLGAAAQGSSVVLAEVVVTARKREESVLEIPVSVTTLSQDQIVDRGIVDTQELSNFTPGFTLQNTGQGGAAGRGNPNIRFRGLGVQQDSAAARAGAIFWDGAYLSDGIGILPLIDLERVEVIKGPKPRSTDATRLPAPSISSRRDPPGNFPDASRLPMRPIRKATAMN